MLLAILLYGNCTTAETHKTKTANKEAQKPAHATCQDHSASPAVAYKINQPYSNAIEKKKHNEQLGKMRSLMLKSKQHAQTHQ